MQIIEQTENKITCFSEKNIANIFHLSDIHIRKENKNDNEIEFNKIIERVVTEMKKIPEQNNLIVIAGDIFDSRYPTTYALYMFASMIEQLSNISPIIIIPGNHDVNSKNQEDKDILNLMCNKMITKNKVHYLRTTGLYRYGQVMFSNCSIFDEKIIDPSLISDKYIKVFLYHGFVKANNVDMQYVTMHKHIKLEQLKGYNLLLLGDIHQ